MFALVSEKPSPVPSSTFVETTRAQQLAWVRAVMAHGNLNQLQLSQRAGISQSTLSKFFNDPTGMARLQTGSVEKIRAITPIPPYQTTAPSTPRGFGEGEAVPYRPHPLDGMVSAIVQKAVEGTNALVPWRLNTRALEAAGYLEGDVLLVDLNATPQSGDIVCAQLYHTGGAETVFRLYEHPFLISATMDGSLRRPVLVDGQNVQIRGVVISTFRPRPYHIAS